jgi:hypothetical protein
MKLDETALHPPCFSSIELCILDARIYPEFLVVRLGDAHATQVTHRCVTRVIFYVSFVSMSIGPLAPNPICKLDSLNGHNGSIIFERLGYIAA